MNERAVFAEVFRLGKVSRPELARATGLSKPTISVALADLERAGLLRARRDGRSIIYCADFDAISDLIRFLMEDCCAGRPEICLPAVEVVACSTSPETSP